MRFRWSNLRNLCAILFLVGVMIWYLLPRSHEKISHASYVWTQDKFNLANLVGFTNLLKTDFKLLNQNSRFINERTEKIRSTKLSVEIQPNTQLVRIETWNSSEYFQIEFNFNEESRLLRSTNQIYHKSGVNYNCLTRKVSQLVFRRGETHYSGSFSEYRYNGIFCYSDQLDASLLDIGPGELMIELDRKNPVEVLDPKPETPIESNVHLTRLEPIYTWTEDRKNLALIEGFAIFKRDQYSIEAWRHLMITSMKMRKTGNRYVVKFQMLDPDESIEIEFLEEESNGILRAKIPFYFNTRARQRCFMKGESLAFVKHETHLKVSAQTTIDCFGSDSFSKIKLHNFLIELDRIWSVDELAPKPETKNQVTPLSNESCFAWTQDKRNLVKLDGFYQIHHVLFENRTEFLPIAMQVERHDANLHLRIFIPYSDHLSIHFAQYQSGLLVAQSNSTYFYRKKEFYNCDLQSKGLKFAFRDGESHYDNFHYYNDGQIFATKRIEFTCYSQNQIVPRYMTVVINSFLIELNRSIEIDKHNPKAQFPKETSA